jgi:hypothetical protein
MKERSATTMSEQIGHSGWLFEPAEPSVGIFHESLVHDCFMNVNGDEAVEEDSIADLGPDGLMNYFTFMRCPRCGEMTVRHEQELTE